MSNPRLDYSDDANRRRLWTWQARVGLAPKAGSCPINVYQVEHATVSDMLIRLAREMVIGKKPGVINWWRSFRPEWYEIRQRANWFEVRLRDFELNAEATPLSLLQWTPIVETGQLLRLLR